ncbi:MAG TPA: tetratricopeptide repeat protein [Kofleriaceae bacterium]|jgi:serine/threonine protein kinase/tetratricopeptide (TPR) repeat protein
MATENDGGAPEAPSSDQDAFAATVAPTTATPATPTPPMRPSKSPTGSRAVSGAEATVAADLVGVLPPLPEVSAALYETGGEIARGGMGRIVAAEDRRLGRKVALKELLEPAGEQMTRFQREALITARLQHPGIVPVYEAGRWPTGEPFFAMKLVAGKPLDQVIAGARSLDERLELLPRIAAACDAIAYAHSQRIIHRDLKPGNVLIGEFGETVVIDWGLAKDLDAVESPDSANRAPRRPSQKNLGVKSTASSTLTVAGAVMGTPAYMAPEQARGETVDQRADVFALGAMLYHVLAGAPPYNARTATDVIAAAALGKVVPLANREKRAPRDLVAIVTRAMEPSPADRYPDAGMLAEELRRFMTGRLVDAHRYTALQRLGRFIKKHRGAVTVATIAVLGFIVGGTMAVHRIMAARDEAQQAERVATTRGVAAEQLIDYMMTHVQRQLTQIGRLDLMAGLSTKVKSYYQTLSTIPGGMHDDDEGRMAEAIELIGRAEHQSGKPDEALATWGEARTKLLGLIDAHPDQHTLKLRAMIAKLDYESGTVFMERGKYDKATNYFTQAGHEYDELRTQAPHDHALMLGAADNDDELGDMLRREGKLDDAFDNYTRAKALRDQAQGGNGRVTDEVMALSTSHLKLGSIYQSRGQSSVAADEYKASLKLRDSLLATAPDNAQVQKAVLDTLEQLAVVETSLGEDSAAIAMYERALPITQTLAQRDPTNIDWEYQRGNVLADLGQVYVGTGRFQDGLAEIDRAVEVHRGLLARDPKTSRYRIALARALVRQGDAQLALGKLDDALATYKESSDLRLALVDAEPTSVAYRRSYASCFPKLADAHLAKGDPASAIEQQEQALAIRTSLVAEAPAQGDFKNELASTEIELGKLLVARDPKRAGTLIAAGLARARALIANDPDAIEWKETLTQGLLAEGLIGDAAARKAAFDEARETAQQAVARSPQNVVWPGYLAEAYIGLGEPAKAHALLEPLAKAGRLPAKRLALLR